MAAHNILSKNDRALAAYLIASGAGSDKDVYPAKLSTDKTLGDSGETICWSERAVEDPPYSGIYTITARVEVRTFAAVDVNQDPDEPKSKSEDRVALTFDAFHRNLDQAGDELAAAITAAAGIAGYTCQDVRVLSVEAGYADQHGRQYNAPVWTDCITLEMIACPANVTND